ncbi:SIP domain-containing protein [Rhizobium sp. NLR16a]|uniref:SIP domain-containing protein n=1 Tax=Rhizobium TaxID=379 RepID=UPI0032BFE8A3
MQVLPRTYSGRPSASPQHHRIAAEASTTRTIRAHLLERGYPLAWIKASGYWVQGNADATEKFG